MKIGLTTDHAGFDQIKQLQEYLTRMGYQCVYYGPKTLDMSDDYPDFIRPAAIALAKGEVEMSVIMGASGQGEAMVANRVPGVRCAVYYGPAAALSTIDAEGRMAADQYEILRLSRQHNNANMLSVAARFVSQPDIEKAVDIWLETDFKQVERHVRRLAKIDQKSV